MADPYVRKKYDRERRLREKSRYIDELCPEVKTASPGLVVDVGPGPGEFLELCRSYGHRVFGIDAATGESGMGDGYLRLSELMCERQGIEVARLGLNKFLDCGFGIADCGLENVQSEIRNPKSAILVNSQGAIEQCFAEHMIGPPHHLHKDCRRLAWRLDDTLAAQFVCMFRTWLRWLRPGGYVLIYANGSQNTAEYESFIARCADKAEGFQLVRHEPRVHKWRKQ